MAQFPPPPDKKVHKRVSETIAVVRRDLYKPRVVFEEQAGNPRGILLAHTVMGKKQGREVATGGSVSSGPSKGRQEVGDERHDIL